MKSKENATNEEINSQQQKQINKSFLSRFMSGLNYALGLDKKENIQKDEKDKLKLKQD